MNSTDSGPMGLNERLDEIEARNKQTMQDFPRLTLALEPHLKNELALVKALRRAMPELKYRRTVDHLPTKAEADITAILNEARAEAPLELAGRFLVLRRRKSVLT